MKTPNPMSAIGPVPKIIDAAEMACWGKKYNTWEARTLERFRSELAAIIAADRKEAVAGLMADLFRICREVTTEYAAEGHDHYCVGLASAMDRFRALAREKGILDE